MRQYLRNAPVEILLLLGHRKHLGLAHRRYAIYPLSRVHYPDTEGAIGRRHLLDFEDLPRHRGDRGPTLREPRAGMARPANRLDVESRDREPPRRRPAIRLRRLWHQDYLVPARFHLDQLTRRWRADFFIW